MKRVQSRIAGEDGAREGRRPRVALFNEHAGGFEPRDLPGAVLGIRIRAADGGDHGEIPPRRGRRPPGLVDDGRKRPGRIGMHAFAQHHVQQDHPHLRIRGLLTQPLGAQGHVEHRMEAADGELIRPQIEHGVRRAPGGRSQRPRAPDRHVGVEGTQHGVEEAHAFRAEGPAAVERAQVPLRRGEPRRRRPGTAPGRRPPGLHGVL